MRAMTLETLLRRATIYEHGVAPLSPALRAGAWLTSLTLAAALALLPATGHLATVLANPLWLLVPTSLEDLLGWVHAQRRALACAYAFAFVTLIFAGLCSRGFQAGGRRLQLTIFALSAVGALQAGALLAVVALVTLHLALLAAGAAAAVAAVVFLLRRGDGGRG